MRREDAVTAQDSLEATGNPPAPVDALRRFPLFAELSEADLDWLVSRGESLQVTTGELLVEEGSPGGSLYVILEGEFEVTKRSGQQEVLLSICGPGEIIGEVSVLAGKPRSASVRARIPSSVLCISQDVFRQLLLSSPIAALGIIRTVTARLDNTEAMLGQQGKMAALGTMAAGLAHELNNPAAAARRSATQLSEALDRWERATAALGGLALDAAGEERLEELRRRMTEGGRRRAHLDPLTRSDLESELQDWLEERGVAEGWELAPVLVAFGWDRQALEPLAGTFGPALQAVVAWLAAGCTVYSLLQEVGHGVERISEIVKAVKSYSYLDQAPIQEIDLHEGLENTLVILRHKLQPHVQVTRGYAADLPRIQAYGSELNQAWTNLIDNAIDAMEGRGELTLRTYPRDGKVVLEVEDNGPGIPADIQDRIFNPFFTTKPPGSGTGLGLHITRNIIVQRHQGRIELDSRPGRTRFRVTLPTRLKRSQSEMVEDHPDHTPLKRGQKGP